jgi:pyruvate/2-oxoglutarate dehydrogenase complex dihydrolipoamide acyltransferase (E2) component
MLRRNTTQFVSSKSGLFSSSWALLRPTIIKMPALSPTMEKGTLVSWECKIGQKIEENTLLAKVQTDKATNDFNYVGDELFIARFIATPGSAVTIGDPVALAVETAADVASDEVKNWVPPQSAKKPASTQKDSPKPATTTTVASTPKKIVAAPASTTVKKVAEPKKSAAVVEALSQETIEAIERSGPAVLRLAASLTTEQINSLFKDTKKFAPSGLNKRFTKADILKFFPNVNFDQPNSASPFTHGKSSKSSEGTATESKTPEKKKEEEPRKRYEITQQIQPGVPGKAHVHDDSVLSFLLRKK